MTDKDAEAFWEFSLSLYGKDGVAPACLALQDKQGADVNILLYLCYLVVTGHRLLDRSDMAVLMEKTDEIRSTVLAPMRALRRRLKTMAASNPMLEPVYRTAKDAELAAEKSQQFELVRHGRALGTPFPKDDDPAAHLRTAIHTFLDKRKTALDPESAQAINTVIMAAMQMRPARKQRGYGEE
ncbi:hypothetical protein JCM17845_13440 [Iodidimonas gelatinilytica]|uniref:TIGR02444 family protein n=1 Tax=Iodidimonas gelatinilytica TaxID=1236966 RepID=A0A5A7MXB0_9PROT|nr:TIGR02444 family protein [Iodidimonas gelatinilytica]GER00721.1 hypothetical protein JCM17845_13440 [Iodidimonas gelatinilytica]